MNAAEQATNLHLASKIATVVNLFKQRFPDARADLKPWANDSATRAALDPDSLDVGFHFPGWSPRLESRSMLVQMHFTVEEEPAKLIGLEVVGLTYEGEQWRISTIADWRVVGRKSPATDTTKKLKEFCHQVFELFHSSV